MWSIFEQEHYFLFLFIRILYRYQFFLRVLLFFFKYPGALTGFQNFVLQVSFFSYDNFLHVRFVSQPFSTSLSEAKDFESWIPFYKRLTTLMDHCVRRSCLAIWRLYSNIIRLLYSKCIIFINIKCNLMKTDLSIIVTLSNLGVLYKKKATQHSLT